MRVKQFTARAAQSRGYVPEKFVRTKPVEIAEFGWLGKRYSNLQKEAESPIMVAVELEKEAERRG